jgi:hypothetical protein
MGQHTQEDQPTIRGSLAQIYNASREEFAQASVAEKAVLATTMGGLAFEWGTGNEALIGAVAANVYDATQNPVLTGLASGGGSFIEQAVLGVLMATTIYNFHNVAGTVRSVTSRPGEEQKRTSGINTFLGAFVLGSAVELAKENATHERTYGQNIRRALGTAAMIGAANTVLLTGASSLITAAQHVGLEHPAEIFVDVASNPLTYVGLFAAKFGFDKVKRYLKGRKERRGDQYEGAHRTQVNDPQQITESEGA